MSGPVIAEIASASPGLFSSPLTQTFNGPVASDNAFATALSSATSQLAAASRVVTASNGLSAPSALPEDAAPSPSLNASGLFVSYEGPMPSTSATSDLASLSTPSGVPSFAGGPLTQATSPLPTSLSTPTISIPTSGVQPVSASGSSVSNSVSGSSYGGPTAKAISSVSTTGLSGAGAAIVNTAQQFVGTPYVWGGTTPAGFDCSGLVQYVYAHNGVQLPRTSEEQASAGQPVASLSQAQPGDLLFFAGSDGTATSPGHVAIYAGGGQMIDAPYTGTTVRVESVSNAGPIVAIRRVIAS